MTADSNPDSDSDSDLGPGPSAPVVTMIGTGAPRLAPERYGSSLAIRSGDTTVLLDCGPATTYKMLQHGLSPLDIDALMITHHHYDHTADVANFLLAHWEPSSGDYEPPRVIGPQPTARFVDLLVGPEGAFRPDIDARRFSPQSQELYVRKGKSLPRPELATRVTEIEARQSAPLPEGWQMWTGHAQHVQPWLDSIAYRIEVAGKHIVFTGDTEYCPEIVELADGADLLITMCCDVEPIGAKPAQIGTEGAARIASEAGVGAVVLTHAGPNISYPGGQERAVGEVAKMFDKQIYFAFEGLEVVVD